MLFLIVVVAVVCPLVLLPALASAQELPILNREAPACRFDSTVIRDTIDFTLFLSPPRSVAKARSRREEYSPHINALASTFEQPPRLSISYLAGKVGRRADR